MIKNISVRWKLVLLTQIILLPFYFLLLSNIKYEYNRALNKENERNAQLAKELEKNFTSIALNHWSAHQFIGHAITNMQAAKIARYLDRMLFEQNNIIEYTWTDNEANVVASTNALLEGINLSQYKYIQEILQGKRNTLSYVVNSKINGEPILPIGTGIYKDGALTGMMLSLIDIRDLDYLFDNEYPTNKTVEIIDSADNTIIIKDNKVNIMNKEQDKKQSSLFHSQQITLQTAPFTDWSIIVSNQSKIQWWEELNVTLIIPVLILSLLSIFLSIFIGNKILSPLVQMKNAATELANGNLSVRVNLDGSDEIAKTAKVFNRMIDRLQNEIKKSDNLLTVSEVAASIAHEVRNPLTTIKGFIQILGEEKHVDLKHKMYYELIIEELDRANAIICDYLSLAQNKIIDRKEININALIEELVPLIKAFSNIKSCAFDVTLDPNLPMIKADGNEIKQVILNLFRNGVEATKNGGVIQLSTKSSEDMVMIEVIDNGCGIPDENLDRLFEGFFTTKDNGTGLGLAVCKSIINKNNGNISVESELGKGSTFTVIFTGTTKREYYR